MAVFRVEKTKDYTVMSNHHLRNSKISLKAKGLLSQMLSLPEGWDYTLAGLASINREGEDAISAAVKELEQHGYIRRRRTQKPDGTFSGIEYVIYEEPVSSEPLPENPEVDNPEVENPVPENPGQLNKDNISPLNPPKGSDVPKKKKRKNDYKPQADTLPERFEKFWAFYRDHMPPDRNAGNRQQAIRAWDKLAPTDSLATSMAISLARQVKSLAWASGVGVPHASTWLNNHGWEDDWGPVEDSVPNSASDSETEEAAVWVT